MAGLKPCPCYETVSGAVVASCGVQIHIAWGFSRFEAVPWFYTALAGIVSGSYVLRSFHDICFRVKERVLGGLLSWGGVKRPRREYIQRQQRDCPWF
jgi:hypothetical protein